MPYVLECSNPCCRAKVRYCPICSNDLEGSDKYILCDLAERKTQEARIAGQGEGEVNGKAEALEGLLEKGKSWYEQTYARDSKTEPVARFMVQWLECLIAEQICWEDKKQRRLASALELRQACLETADRLAAPRTETEAVQDASESAYAKGFADGCSLVRAELSTKAERFLTALD